MKISGVSVLHRLVAMTKLESQRRKQDEEEMGECRSGSLPRGCKMLYFCNRNWVYPPPVHTPPNGIQLLAGGGNTKFLIILIFLQSILCLAMLNMGYGNMLLMLLMVLSILDTIPSLEETSFQVEIGALKEFKSLIIQDSVQVLADWSDETHHCNWTGIACDPVSNHVLSLSLPHKQLKGQISPYLGNISKLQFVNLGSNSLTGSIPMEFGYLKNLQVLQLTENSLNGSIPQSICNCTSLSSLDISMNKLTGMIPSCIGNLVGLVEFVAFENRLVGSFPVSIAKLEALQVLNLSRNRLAGKLPLVIAMLHHLKYLDLSCNYFSGRIPSSFTNLTNLKYINFSFNHFQGPVPTDGIFRNLSLLSLTGNLALCGTSYLPPCNIEEKSNALGGILFLGCAFVICGTCFRKQKPKFTENPERQRNLTFLPKKFSQEDLEIATNSFDESNVIARGGLSSVYKGIMAENQVVVVKKWELFQVSAESDHSFRRGLITINNLKHRNLVKMIGYGWERGFKALVLDYMENGTLESVIHDPGTNRSRWTLSQRLKVCVSVANALVYLHSDYGEKTVCHCDVKPSIIFFDGDWEAHLGNFGTYWMCDDYDFEGCSFWSSSSPFLGTVGYSAPELGYTCEVTTQADVFSFGIVMMEFLTTRRPTETIEDEGFPFPITLRQFVEVSLKHGSKGILQVVDPYFAQSISIQQEEDRLIELLGLALSCTHPVPEDRPDMKEVLSFLLRLKEI